jgi:hypothetical protein
VIAPDAVAVYNIFGLNYGGAAALLRVVVTAFIIILTIRIPFKRTYHWMFLALSVVTFLFVVGALYYSLSADAATAYSRVWPLFVFGTRVQDAFFILFVVYFVARKLRLWHRLVIIGAFAYAVATVELPIAIGDQSFDYGKAVLGPTGWNSAPGTADIYLRPNGIDIFTSATGVLIFALLLWHYRSEKSAFVRGETKYLVLGAVFFVASGLSIGIVRYLGAATFPSPQQYLGAVADLILLLGLRKKGFYSVTPTAETATADAPIRYPLEDGHSYLAHDPQAAFEGFSELVRSGHEGLLVTRIIPDVVRKDYGLQTTPIRWLAEERRDDAIPPGDLLGLSLTVKDFLEKAKKPVVMLHGIEYLATYDGFTPTLRLIHGLSESSAAKMGILILPVVPDSLSKQDEALLIAETTPLPVSKS